MYTLPNFCRVCLKYDKNLIDLEHIENEPSETLMTKLQHCVSEVEWTQFKPLLCHPCIKRLNIAYTFKKQCVQSATVLKSYVQLVKETKKKNEAQAGTTSADNAAGATAAGAAAAPQGGGAYMMLPNQKYIKIVMGGGTAQTQNNNFQNVFLNVVPTSAMGGGSAVTIEPARNSKNTGGKDVFQGINSTFQKFVSGPQHQQQQQGGKNVNLMSQIMTDTKTEEVSVEIDPMDFNLYDEEDGSGSEDEDERDENNSGNDWEELISHSQITSESVAKQQGARSNGDSFVNGAGSSPGLVKSPALSAANFVPILPKDLSGEQKAAADFFYSGHHFLSSSSPLPQQQPNQRLPSGEISCEQCQKKFHSLKLLKHHFKEFHMGKLPFKCSVCYKDHMVRWHLEACMKLHKTEAAAGLGDGDTSDTSLTLKDFELSQALMQDPTNPVLLQTFNLGEHQPKISAAEEANLTCDVCLRVFTSAAGLLRHKVRKHNQQQGKKKYFIKGMKNARCDICNREFSTQSYMQLHRKLHMRDDIGYKYKVFSKSRYVGGEGSSNNNTEEDSKNNSEVDPAAKSKSEESPAVLVKSPQKSRRSHDKKEAMKVRNDVYTESDEEEPVIIETTPDVTLELVQQHQQQQQREQQSSNNSDLHSELDIKMETDNEEFEEEGDEDEEEDDEEEDDEEEDEDNEDE